MRKWNLVMFCSVFASGVGTGGTFWLVCVWLMVGFLPCLLSVGRSQVMMLMGGMENAHDC